MIFQQTIRNKIQRIKDSLEDKDIFKLDEEKVKELKDQLKKLEKK